jgi:hypothetical protein
MPEKIMAWKRPIAEKYDGHNTARKKEQARLALGILTTLISFKKWLDDPQQVVPGHEYHSDIFVFVLRGSILDWSTNAPDVFEAYMKAMKEYNSNIARIMVDHARRTNTRIAIDMELLDPHRDDIHDIIEKAGIDHVAIEHLLYQQFCDIIFAHVVTGILPMNPIDGIAARYDLVDDALGRALVVPFAGSEPGGLLCVGSGIESRALAHDGGGIL